MRGRLVAAFLAALGGGAISASEATATAVEIEALVLSGDPVPDGPVGATFFDFGPPSVGAGEHVAFQATYRLQGAGFSFGLFLVDPDGSVAKLALVGETPSDAGGRAIQVVDSIIPPGVAEDGTVFAFTTIGPASDVAILRAGDGALVALAIEGDDAPGLVPAMHGALLGRPLVSRAGDVAFRGNLQGAGVDATNDSTIWRMAPTNTFPLSWARTGDDPGDPPGTEWSLLNSLLLSEAADLLFVGRLTTGVGGTDLFTNGGIWQIGDDGTQSLRLRKGDATPGIAGGRFGDFADMGLVTNRFGDLAFMNRLPASGAAGIDSLNDEGVWGPDAGGALTLLAREGDPAPGVAGGLFGTVHVSNTKQIRIDDARAAAFVASLQVGPGGVGAGNDVGIWGREADGAVSLWVREGDPVPGAAAGVLLGGRLTNLSLLDGALVFSDGTPGSAADDFGVFHRAADGEFTTLAREGEVWEIAPGDERTIASIGFVAGLPQSGYPGGFGASGRVALRIGFTDGSAGVFAATVPEPEAGLGVAAIAALLIQRRFRNARG